LDADLARIIIICTTVILVAGITGFSIVGSVAFSRVEKGAGKSFGLLFQRGNFLRITTVVIVVVAAMFLALAGKLSDGAVALLSGVAGIALGGLDRSKHDDNEHPQP